MKLLSDQEVYASTVLFLRNLGHDIVTATGRGLSASADIDESDGTYKRDGINNGPPKERFCMTTSSEQVLDAALALPDEDRLEIVEALAASLLPSDRPPFDESWRGVIQRRSAELRSGKLASVPWSEVKKRAREKIGD